MAFRVISTAAMVVAMATSAVAQQMPTPPAGDMAWAASPISSSPGRCPGRTCAAPRGRTTAARAPPAPPRSRPAPTAVRVPAGPVPAGPVPAANAPVVSYGPVVRIARGNDVSVVPVGGKN